MKLGKVFIKDRRVKPTKYILHLLSISYNIITEKLSELKNWGTFK